MVDLELKKKNTAEQTKHVVWAEIDPRVLESFLSVFT